MLTDEIILINSILDVVQRNLEIVKQKYKIRIKNHYSLAKTFSKR